MDRFERGLPDPQNNEPDEYCICSNPNCQRVIYVGEECRKFSGMIMCNDLICVSEITESKLLIAGEEE